MPEGFMKKRDRISALKKVWIAVAISTVDNALKLKQNSSKVFSECSKVKRLKDFLEER